MTRLRNVLIHLTLALAVLGPLAASVASAQDRTERVTFAPGKTGTLLRDRVRGYRGVNYVLGASAGQKLSVEMVADNDSAYFNIRRSGSSEAIYNGSVDGNSTSVILPSGGDWVVQVYLMRNAARRDEVANYRLSVSIEGRGSVGKPPVGDADASGPDFWVVAGVAAGDLLNVRAGPSTNDRVLARVGNGVILRNGGCVGEGRGRWCKVSDPDGGYAGWASGRYLRESAGPAAGGGPVQALLPELCRSAVALTYDLSIRSLKAYAPQPAGKGFEVYVESSATGRGFNCRFGAKGNLVEID